MLADYAAPELGQAPETGHKGGGPTWQTEIYSLGCTLFHLMAGRPPFTGDDVSAKLMQHATAEPVAPLETFGVPPWVAQVVSQMMDKDVTRRFQNPQQVAAALGALLQPASAGAAPAGATAPAAEPDIAPPQALPPLDLSSAGDPTADAAPSRLPIDFPPPAMAPDNFGFFDAIAAAPGRTRRTRKNSGLQLATVILLLCMIGGVIVLALVLIKKGEKSKAGAPTDTAANSPADSDSSKATSENDTESSDSNESATSAQGESDSRAPSAASGPADADSDRQKPTDDKHALWASPTRGAPVSLDYVPPGRRHF